MTPLRFSHRPNRADEIAWRPWSRAGFQAAADADRPVLLHLAAAWSHWCHRMDEETYSDPSVIERINGDFVAVRVDTDGAPHIRDRYIAGGWPTVAFLTPTGEVLWSGTYLDPDGFREIADGVLGAWSGRRAELQAEIERRRAALDAARGREAPSDHVGSEAAEPVLDALRNTFDARNGGFGDAPKFPAPEAIELLWALARRADDPDWAHMARHTLDGMLAGELLDRVDGGFFRYALEADWTAPRHEKVLAANAGLVEAFALGVAEEGRDDWRDAVVSGVEWVETRLSRKDGLWGNSQTDDPDYYEAEPRSGPEPPVDLVAFTGPNALWVRALARAGAALERPDWIARAARGIDAILGEMAAGDLLHRTRSADETWTPGLLEDLVHSARACIAVARAASRAELVDEARRLADSMRRHLWNENGGFVDHVAGEDSVGALAYTDRPFPANADAALLFLELDRLDAGPGRHVAGQVLALLEPVAARYGQDAAPFALAVTRFHG